MKMCFFRAVAGILAAALFLPVQVNAISAQKAIVLDGQTGRVLFSNESDIQTASARGTLYWITCRFEDSVALVALPRQLPTA